MEGNNERFESKAVLFDLNGTLGVEGKSSGGYQGTPCEALGKIHRCSSQRRHLWNLGGGTKRPAHQNREGLERCRKGRDCQRLTPYVAVGNGNNDVAMLEKAELAFCVIGREGATVDALLASDIVVTNVRDAMEMLLKGKKLMATLRG